ncbi:hypothetical protein V1517DRAFT_323470 [Lipomyces orientalis]|uniref:Uncharacterized protein n=1 Tax=Lipomyces orientalis TaxID=1233043 RepID=A0ACC3TNA1_9ASCO
MTVGSIKRVAVLGAGASGLSAIAALVEENCFEQLKVFERNANAGGLWNYTEYIDMNVALPSTDPSVAMEPLVDATSKVKTWAGAAYDNLITNVPSPIMLFENPDYDKEFKYFSHRSDIADFLQHYARKFEHLISYNSNVLDVRKENGEWIVTYEPGVPGSVPLKEAFDAVVVATGYFNVPYVPDVSGLHEYLYKYPGSIIHSKIYRTPEPYKNKTVLVVGNAASGIDISNQLVSVTGKKVYKSVRSETIAPGKSNPLIEEVTEIEFFEAEDKKIHLKDGTVLDDVDVVIYATGYLRSLPFLSQINEGSHPLITDGSYVRDLFLHFVYTKDPTLALLGTPRFVLPFRVSQAQACYIARVWSGRLKLPPKAIMDSFVRKRYHEVGDSKAFHDLKYPEDADFCEYILALCQLVPGHHGLFPRKWTKLERSLRKDIGNLKVAFAQYLEDTGRFATSREELVQSGLLGQLEIDDSEPNFSTFGKVLDGDQYTEEDILEATRDLLERVKVKN